MKVLHLSTHVNAGGITSYILESAREFKRRGHEVAVLSSGGDFEKSFSDELIEHQFFSIRTKNEFHPKLIIQLPRILRYVRSGRFDLIHAHTRVTQNLAAWISFWTRVPFVTTAHGFYRPGISRRLFPSWGKRVVAVSPLVSEDLVKRHRVSSDKIRVVYNAIDIARFRSRLLKHNPTDIRKSFGISDATFVVGNISRLVEDKGHRYLIEAFSKFVKKFPDSFLLIVGEGRQRNQILKLIGKHRLQSKAKLLTHQSDIPALLSIMDVFVHPATYREGFGLSMLEATVAKIPVVATNIWAINTIIRDRINGFLVEPKNSAQIAEVLEFIKQSSASVEAITENAFKHAERNYSIERLADELEVVYREVITIAIGPPPKFGP